MEQVKCDQHKLCELDSRCTKSWAEDGDGRIIKFICVRWSSTGLKNGTMYLHACMTNVLTDAQEALM